MATIYKGGLTGGDIAVGYHIEYDPKTFMVDFRADVAYNGVISHCHTKFTKELLVEKDWEELEEVILRHIELALIEGVSDAILDKIDTKDLVNKVKGAASGKPIDTEYTPKSGEEVVKWHTGGITSGNSTMTFLDDQGYEVVMPIASAGNTVSNPASELVSACKGLKTMVKYPRSKDPEANWPEQKEDRLEYVIIWLNDQVGWSFNQIADWIETLDVDINIDLSQAEGGES